MIMRKNDGFTLIELLIVVAIISVLAAIAVPNFLEAQTRSKAARVKADQRTIATALESYHVDHNRYPPQGPVTLSAYPWIGDETQVYGGDSPRHAPNNRPIAWNLSTPIAYLSDTKSVFTDPFFRNFNVEGTNIVNDTRYYNYSGDYYGGRTYRPASDGPVALFEQSSLELQQLGGWHLRSRGPDGDYEPRSNGWADYIKFRGEPGKGSSLNGGINAAYDPTNGTVSGGDIARFGKGANPQLR
jgi:prepilin-type N-terminal cleavage/methylation domain-containing protein